MTTYRILELQNSNSSRAAVLVDASDLTQAKRLATRSQIFQGTTLVVESEAGGRLAIKEPGGRWTETKYA